MTFSSDERNDTTGSESGNRSKSHCLLTDGGQDRNDDRSSESSDSDQPSEQGDGSPPDRSQERHEGQQPPGQGESTPPPRENQRDQPQERQPRDQQRHSRPQDRQGRPQEGQPQDRQGQPQGGRPQEGRPQNRQGRPQGGQPPGGRQPGGPQSGGRGPPDGDSGGLTDKLSRRTVLAGGGVAAAAAAGGWWFFLRGASGGEAAVEEFYVAIGDGDWETAEELLHEDTDAKAQLEADVDPEDIFLDGWDPNDVDISVEGLYESMSFTGDEFVDIAIAGAAEDPFVDEEEIREQVEEELDDIEEALFVNAVVDLQLSGDALDEFVEQEADGLDAFEEQMEEGMTVPILVMAVLDDGEWYVWFEDDDDPFDAPGGEI